MAVFFLLFHIILVLAFAVLGLACLRVRGMTGHLLGLFVVAYADIVLALQAAGLLNVVNRIAVTSIQILFTALAIALWLRLGRPPLLAPFASVRIEPPPGTLRHRDPAHGRMQRCVRYLLRASVITATHRELRPRLSWRRWGTGCSINQHHVL
jgi:hypothetical protein